MAKGDVTLQWCPTGDMTADFFTKPLQGALFRKFRDLIMGVMAQPEPGPGKPSGVKKEKSPKTVKLGKRTGARG